MPSITLKNIPDKTYKALKVKAVNHRRSLNSELIYRLERSLALDPKPVDVKKLLTVADRINRKTIKHPITEKDLKRYKSMGRL